MAGLLLIKKLVLLVWIGFELADTLDLGSFVAINFLVSIFLMRVGWMVMYQVDTRMLGSMVAILLFSSKFHSL